MIVWKKSTRSGPWTDNCVEVGTWTHASGCDSSQCIEVCGVDDGDVLVRDSKNPEGFVQRYTSDEWNAFIEGVKLGEFDL